MERDLIRFLQDIDIFEDLSPPLLQHVIDRAEVVEFARGTQIITLGEAGECMYIVIEGEVQIPVLNEAGKLQYTSELRGGQIFGEMALLTGHPRSSDVFAASDCQCLKLSRKIVLNLMRAYPHIAQVLTAILSERVRRAGTPQKVGKYSLLNELARGSMAVVYEGLHPDLHRPLAIKMLHHELVYQPQFSERFRNEAKIVAHLRHPNIVEVFDLEEAYGTFFIIMEKVKGIELQHAIQTRGKMSYPDARRVLHQLLSALQFAHGQGVIHRDLKPSNIMLDRSGNVKLMDFGIALLPQKAGSPEEEDMLLGTPHFMSPEQHKAGPVDHRADLYALGIVAYNMITGELPFEGSLAEIAEQKRKRKFINVRKVAPDIPEDLEVLICSCTSREPEERPESCKVLQRSLEPVEAPEGYEMSQLSTQTLTFLYPPQEERKVQQLLKKYRERAEKLHEVRVFVQEERG